MLLFIRLFFVCLCQTNVKTAEPIGPKFCVGPHMTPGKVYKTSRLGKKLLENSRNLFFLKMSQLEKKNLAKFYRDLK